MGKKRRHQKKKNNNKLPLGVLVGFGTETQDPSARITSKGNSEKFEEQFDAALRFAEQTGGVIKEIVQEYDADYPDRVVARIRYRRSTEDSA